jgi:hypothetical protein
MLITAKPLTKKDAKFGPTNVCETVGDGLDPTLARTYELHRGDTHPHRLIDRIHVKLGLGVSDPKLCGDTVELGKMHFG